MKKLRNLIAVMAMMSMAAVLAGCGDDDDEDGHQPPPPNQIVAPGDESALTAQNRIYTVTVPGETNQIILTFPGQGQYRIEQGAEIETGSIMAASLNRNTWTFTKMPGAGQDGAVAGRGRLDFTAPDQGTWTFTPEGGTAQTGSFALTLNLGRGDAGGNGGGGGLSDQSLKLTYAQAGERFDFTSESAVTYDPASAHLQGTYTWDPTGRVINITLNNNWTFQITLGAGNTGTAIVVFDDPTSEPETGTGNYTLTPGL
jgi:hypothetical protein